MRFDLQNRDNPASLPNLVRSFLNWDKYSKEASSAFCLRNNVDEIESCFDLLEVFVKDLNRYNNRIIEILQSSEATPADVELNSDIATKALRLNRLLECMEIVASDEDLNALQWKKAETILEKGLPLLERIHKAYAQKARLLKQEGYTEEVAHFDNAAILLSGITMAYHNLVINNWQSRSNGRA